MRYICLVYNNNRSAFRRSCHTNRLYVLKRRKPHTNVSGCSFSLLQKCSDCSIIVSTLWIDGSMPPLHNALKLVIIFRLIKWFSALARSGRCGADAMLYRREGGARPRTRRRYLKCACRLMLRLPRDRNAAFP